MVHPVRAMGASEWFVPVCSLCGIYGHLATCLTANFAAKARSGCAYGGDRPRVITDVPSTDTSYELRSSANAMSHESHIVPNLLRDDSFEIVMRGYSRRQVDEYIARCRSQIRDLEDRLTRALNDVERTEREIAQARERRPTGDDLSE